MPAQWVAPCLQWAAGGEKNVPPSPPQTITTHAGMSYHTSGIVNGPGEHGGRRGGGGGGGAQYGQHGGGHDDDEEGSGSSGGADDFSG